MSDTQSRQSDSSPGFDAPQNQSANDSRAEPGPGQSATSTQSNETQQSSEPGVEKKAWRSRDKPLRYLISILLLGVGVGSLFALSLLKKKPESRESTVLIQQVELNEVQPYAGQLDLTVSGTVVPHMEIDVAVEISGRVKKKHAACQAGNFVKAGTSLVEIDTEEYDIELKRLEADVDQANKRIQETDQQITGEMKSLALAKQDYDIQQREYERNARLKDVISKSELDQVRRAVNNAIGQVTNRQNAIDSFKATRVRLESALELAKRQLDKANLNLRRTIVTAPVDGVIVSELVQENDYVRQGDQIITFEDTSKSEVQCNLTTSDLAWIRANSKQDPANPLSVYQLPKTDVVIYEKANPEISWKGTLERFDGIGRDPVTKTIPCRIIVDQPVVETAAGQRALVRGMFVKCRVEVQTSAGDESNNLVSFTELALQPNNQVWLVEDKKLKAADVKIVDRLDRDSLSDEPALIVARPIGKELKPGSMVVVSPLSQPTNGAPVTIAGEKSATDKESKESTDSNSNDTTQDESSTK